MIISYGRRKITLKWNFYNNNSSLNEICKIHLIDIIFTPIHTHAEKKYIPLRLSYLLHYDYLLNYGLLHFVVHLGFMIENKQVFLHSNVTTQDAAASLLNSIDRIREKVFIAQLMQSKGTYYLHLYIFILIGRCFLVCPKEYVPLLWVKEFIKFGMHSSKFIMESSLD